MISAKSERYLRRVEGARAASANPASVTSNESSAGTRSDRCASVVLRSLPPVQKFSSSGVLSQLLDQPSPDDGLGGRFGPSQYDLDTSTPRPIRRT